MAIRIRCMICDSNPPGCKQCGHNLLVCASCTEELSCLRCSDCTNASNPKRHRIDAVAVHRRYHASAAIGKRVRLSGGGSTLIGGSVDLT